MKSEQKHSLMPSVITLALTAMVSGLLYALYNKALPQDNSELGLLIIGQVMGLWTAAVSYWIGTSRSSAEKDRKPQ